MQLKNMAMGLMTGATLWGNTATALNHAGKDSTPFHVPISALTEDVKKPTQALEDTFYYKPVRPLVLLLNGTGNAHISPLKTGASTGAGACLISERAEAYTNFLVTQDLKNNPNLTIKSAVGTSFNKIGTILNISNTFSPFTKGTILEAEAGFKAVLPLKYTKGNCGNFINKGKLFSSTLFANTDLKTNEKAIGTRLGLTSINLKKQKIWNLFAEMKYSFSSNGSKFIPSAGFNYTIPLKSLKLR